MRKPGNEYSAIWLARRNLQTGPTQPFAMVQPAKASAGDVQDHEQHNQCDDEEREPLHPPRNAANAADLDCLKHVGVLGLQCGGES
jgi:hypothetical protein